MKIIGKTDNVIWIGFKAMENDLKVIGSKPCGREWDNPTGTLYTIRIGEKRLNNRRLAYKPYPDGEPVWIKKEFEQEASRSSSDDLAEKTYLFDNNEPSGAIGRIIAEHENMQLKIVDSIECGSVWNDTYQDGVLYTIQVGNDSNNLRLAFLPEKGRGPVWVKKGKEEEALNSVKDITSKQQLFDNDGKEPREALVKLFLPPQSGGVGAKANPALKYGIG